MRCILLKTPGEIVEDAYGLEANGFDWEVVETTQDTSSLSDVRSSEFQFWLRVPLNKTDKPYARSLRASFANLLLAYENSYDDFIIFGESDIAPNVDASTVRAVVEKALAQHKDLDVLRLHLHLVEAPSQGIADCYTFRMPQFDSYTDVNYSWGTHALVIPKSSRRKVAELFRDCKLPIDVALEALNYKDELKVYVTSADLFYQKKRTARPDVRKQPHWRERNMAVCITSYKRPESAIKQIYTFLHQTYNPERFHIFAVVKGISEFLFNSLIVTQFKSFIEAGRLTLRYAPNKSQLSNFLDCTRGLDIDKFDLFLKVDDDDFYNQTYLEAVNEFHAKIAQTSCSVMQGACRHLSKKEGIIAATLGFHYYVMGASFVMTREVLEGLKKAETDESYRQSLWKRVWNSGQMDIRQAEDQLMHRLMQDVGLENRLQFVHSKAAYIPHITVNASNEQSVTRGNFMNSYVASGQGTEECLFSLDPIAKTESNFICIGPRILNVDTKAVGTLQQNTDHVKLVKWESGDVMHLAKSTAGVWIRTHTS